MRIYAWLIRLGEEIAIQCISSAKNICRRDNMAGYLLDELSLARATLVTQCDASELEFYKENLTSRYLRM